MRDPFLEDAIETHIVDELPPGLLTAAVGSEEDGELFCDICGSVPPNVKTKRGLALHKGRIHGASDRVPAAKKRAKRGSEELRHDLETLIGALSVGVSVANARDGQIIANGNEKLCAALVKTSEKNPKLRKFLENLTSGFAYSELSIAVAAIALPIMANHGLLPDRAAAAVTLLAGVPDDASAMDSGTLFG